ncbi:MAG: CvpA family protein [Clostridia bacterium]|nr:CvpA family protein [Clostridia bacterium]
MNATALSSALTCIFFIFLILGFLYGLWRGFSKSLTRFFIVIAVAVATFFIVPAISKTLLTVDISSWNLEVEGVAVQNLQQFITEFLSNIEQINELMNASPTFEAFIQVVPQILLNIVLFLLLFLVVKMLSMIIYWIICAIAFPKKKMADKKKHRFVGGIVGAVQGLFVALVVLLPVFGIINLAGDAKAAIVESETAIEASQSSSESQAPATINGHIFSVSENEQNNESSVDIFGTINEYSTALQENGVFKALNAIGLVKLSNSVFDELTTVKVNNSSETVEYKLTTEAVEISKLYPYINLITQSEFNIEDNSFINKIIMLVDASSSSPLLSDIVCEIVNEAATIWTDENVPNRADRLFIGIAAPDLGDEDLNLVLDNQLKLLKNADKTTVQESLVGILKIAQIANTTKDIVTEIQEGLANISTENLTDLFENIVSNDMVQTLVEEVLTEEKLTETFGLDAGTAEMVSGIMNDIAAADAETIKNEVEATKELFTLSEKITTNGSGQINLTTPDDDGVTPVETLVDAIAESTIIKDFIVDKINEDTAEGEENIIQQLDIANKVDEQTKTAITQKVAENLTAGTIDQETAAAFEKIFGITIPTNAD